MDAWQLFFKCFSWGDEVIVIDDDDQFWWGKLGRTKTPDLTFTLKRPRQRIKRLNWVDVRFMSHDGFPVRKLVGADGSDTIGYEQTVAELVRTKLAEEFPGPVRHAVIGDPFLIGPCTAEIFNPGNNGPLHWGEDDEECVLLAAIDGAMAQWFDLPSTYRFELQS